MLLFTVFIHLYISILDVDDVGIDACLHSLHDLTVSQLAAGRCVFVQNHISFLSLSLLINVISLPGQPIQALQNAVLRCLDLPVVLQALTDRALPRLAGTVTIVRVAWP